MNEPIQVQPDPGENVTVRLANFDGDSLTVVVSRHRAAVLTYVLTCPSNVLPTLAPTPMSLVGTWTAPSASLTIYPGSGGNVGGHGTAARPDLPTSFMLTAPDTAAPGETVLTLHTSGGTSTVDAVLTRGALTLALGKSPLSLTRTEAA